MAISVHGPFETEPNHHGREHGQQAGLDHLADGRRCGDGNAVGVLGLAVGGFINLAVLLGPFVHWLVAVFLHLGERGIQLGYVPELPLHFDNHVAGRATYGVDGHGGEQEGQHRAHEKAGHHVGVGNVDVIDAGHAHVGGEQREGGERGGANREAFADGGGGVAHSVEAVGAGADLLGQLAHLGDAAGVVGDRAVGVHGELDAGVGQHADGGDCDAVQTSKVIRAEDGRCEKQDWQHRRAHAHSEAGNDVGGRAALG